MTTIVEKIRCNCWPFNRVMMFILAGAFAGLMSDIRMEHVDVVHTHKVAWLPIIYAGIMTLVCFGTFLAWKPFLRRFAVVMFVIAIGIGMTGFYLHNQGDLIGVMKASIRVWTDKTIHHTDDPPATAPLAFAGLGVIGILATMKRFD